MRKDRVDLCTILDWTELSFQNKQRKHNQLTRNKRRLLLSPARKQGTVTDTPVLLLNSANFVTLSSLPLLYSELQSTWPTLALEPDLSMHAYPCPWITDCCPADLPLPLNNEPHAVCLAYSRTGIRDCSLPDLPLNLKSRLQSTWPTLAPEEYIAVYLPYPCTWTMNLHTAYLTYQNPESQPCSKLQSAWPTLAPEQLIAVYLLYLLAWDNEVYTHTHTHTQRFRSGLYTLQGLWHNAHNWRVEGIIWMMDCTWTKDYRPKNLPDPPLLPNSWWKSTWLSYKGTWAAWSTISPKQLTTVYLTYLTFAPGQGDYSLPDLPYLLLYQDKGLQSPWPTLPTFVPGQRTTVSLTYLTYFWTRTKATTVSLTYPSPWTIAWL